VRVLEPAELGALAAVAPNCVGVELDRVRPARQKLWITSALRTSSRIGVRTGMWISLAVTAFVPG